MIQIYTDGSLAYDSRLDAYDLLTLQVTTGVSVGGSATITMPPQHPAYSSFISFKTVVEIYRDNVLVFRGRPLYPTDDFLGRRTITCEGERCFLRDAVSRPYDYNGTPANVFTAVIGVYNGQVQSDKQFVVGSITVTDPNNYIRLTTETAEQISDTIDKLVERCGGYIVFTTNNQGKRVINWYAAFNYQSTQTIQFGENLLDFARSANTDIATRIIPYGAKDETTGARLTIESVNAGLDYVEDTDAVTLRGVITKAIYWDDVTVAANLKAKALQYLASSKLIITSLTISAVDLTAAGLSVDQFRAGDNIHVISPPHGVDTWMLLETMTLDLLNPAGSLISLGKSYVSLIGADVAANKESRSDLQHTERDIRADYTKDVAVAVSTATTELTSLIQQTSDSILSTVSTTYVTNGKLTDAEQDIRDDYAKDLASTEKTLSSKIEQTSKNITSTVAETYVTNNRLTQEISTQVTQTKNAIMYDFNNLKNTVEANEDGAQAQFTEINKYIHFVNGDIILGETGNEITLRIENDRIAFLSGGVEIAYFSDRRLNVTDGEFVNSLKLGSFAFMPRANGNLSFVKVV